jgi:glycosyltransferase involved in cell wall biosynthesis
MANKNQPSRKILIAHYLPNIVSGAENSIADFIDLIDKRFHVTMLVPGEGALANFYRKHGFNVWIKNVSTPRRIFPGLHTIQSRLLAWELKRKGYDVVLCNTFPAASRVGTACRMAKIPYAIYMRDYIKDTPLHRRILQKANAVFAISKDVQSHLDGMVNPAIVHLAYNYIHPDPILDRSEAHAADGQRRLPFSSSHPVVGLVGRITPYKRPDLFLRAVPHILEQVPDARFVVIGTAQEREKAFEAQVRALAKELGVEEQVAFLGQRRDAVELTSEFTISCLASGREPLGRVILEANLLNIPVVVPDTGGPAEIVEDKETGLYFASQAPDAHIQLARQVIRLLKDSDLRDCLASNARKRIFNTFASLRHIQIQEDLIERLCHNSR